MEVIFWVFIVDKRKNKTSAFNLGGYQVNQYEISGQFSGVLIGIVIIFFLIKRRQESLKKFDIKLRALVWEQLLEY